MALHIVVVLDSVNLGVLQTSSHTTRLQVLMVAISSALMRN